MNRFIMPAALIALLFAGCGRRQEVEAVPSEAPAKAAVSKPQEKPVSPKPQEKPVATATPSEVAVRIDGRDLTRADIIRNGKVLLLLNMNKTRKKSIKSREVRVIEKFCRTAVQREISRAAVSLYLKERGLSPSSNDIRRVTRRFERQYGVRSRKLRRWHNVGDLKYMLGKNAFRVDEMIVETANYDVMTNDVVRANAKTIDVTDDMVNARLAKIREANLRSAATNRLVFAQATNVWRKIVSKELAFEEAAKRFSEDEYISSGCDWGTFTREQLEGETALLALLPTLKTGDVTAPIESDDGVAILRKEEDDNTSTFSFSRVFFRLPYVFEELPAKELREELRAEKTGNLVKDALQSYREKLKIEYPNGTNLVWKLKPQDFK